MGHYAYNMIEDTQTVMNWFSDAGFLNAATLTSLQGKTNKNYRVTFKGKEFHLKVRQHGEFPSFKKLRYVNGLLASHSVSYAPIVEAVARHKKFPYGAILFEWKGGRSITNLSEYEELLPNIFSVLKMIHAIRAPYYENMDLGLRETSYANFITAVLRTHIERCRKGHLLDPSIETRLATFLSTIRCGREVSPVLVHRDATKSNLLLRSCELPILIDWDNAEFTAPLSDVARIIFVYRWIFDDDKRNRILSAYLGAEARKDEEDILKAEYVRNALEGLIFKDTDSQYCRTIIDHVLQ